MNQQPAKENIILYISFNRDSSCFAVGTETGYGVYNTISPRESFVRNMNGGIGIVEMMDRSNILALVGGGKNPKYSSNKVVIWDENQSKVISEIGFNLDVLNVKLTRTHLFVVISAMVYEFEMMSFKRLRTFNLHNPKGLFSLWYNKNDPSIYKYATIYTNYIYIIYNDSTEKSAIEFKGDVECLALSDNGNSLVATRIKGNSINVYEENSSAKYYSSYRWNDWNREYKRGSDNTEICHFVFDIKNSLFACTNNKKTIHLYSKCIDSKYTFNKGNESDEGKGIFGKLFGGDTKTVSSDKSIFQFKINETNAVCCFGPENTLIVVTREGHYYRFQYDPKTGDSSLQEEMDIDLVKG